jgi:two-component system LytT family sensor kinase
VPDELLDVSLPFLTVQALVEHAVRHGIEGTPRGGTLHIRAERLDDTHCALTVADDGPGRDSQRLGRTVAEVRQRLAEAPGPAGSLDVVSADGAGTTVTVRLPIGPGRLKR